MAEKMTTKELIQHTQEMLDETEDDYVIAKHKIIKMEIDLDEMKKSFFDTQDWDKLGITKITKQNKHVDEHFINEVKEINKIEKEKDEAYYRMKQLGRRNRFLMEIFKQEGIDKMFEEIIE